MKILTRKKQDEIVERIYENDTILINKYISTNLNDDFENFNNHIKNSRKLLILIGRYDKAINYFSKILTYLRIEQSKLQEEIK